MRRENFPGIIKEFSHDPYEIIFAYAVLVAPLNLAIKLAVAFLAVDCRRNNSRRLRGLRQASLDMLSASAGCVASEIIKRSEFYDVPPLTLLFGSFGRICT